MLELREREHETHNAEEIDSPAIFRALKKLWNLQILVIQGMKAQVKLMTWMVKA